MIALLFVVMLDWRIVCVFLLLQFFHFKFHDAGWHAACKASGELHIGRDSLI